jgi:predicted negative regulator of RcsB-dependent stress response
MAQILTVVSILALVGLLGWRYADRLFERRQQPAGPAVRDQVIEQQRFERQVYKASAQDFLHGAADLTFGFLILGLGFFMLMWVIATG